MLSRIKRTARMLTPGWKALCFACGAAVLATAVAGCNELTLQDDPVPHDAVESWATPLRAAPVDASDKTDKKKKADDGKSFFFNQKSHEIEKSLGL